MEDRHDLKSLSGFAPKIQDVLREELSVTTAEDFLYFASHYRDQMARLLGIGPREVDRFAETAASVIPESEVASITDEPDNTHPYRTGHDAPSAPNGTFWEGR